MIKSLKHKLQMKWTQWLHVKIHDELVRLPDNEFEVIMTLMFRDREIRKMNDAMIENHRCASLMPILSSDIYNDLDVPQYKNCNDLNKEPIRNIPTHTYPEGITDPDARQVKPR